MSFCRSKKSILDAGQIAAQQAVDSITRILRPFVLNDEVPVQHTFYLVSSRHVELIAVSGEPAHSEFSAVHCTVRGIGSQIQRSLRSTSRCVY